MLMQIKALNQQNDKIYQSDCFYLNTNIDELFKKTHMTFN